MALTDSQFAMYEGMIALAWADHTLDANEKDELHRLIDANVNMDASQREKLHQDIDKPVALKEIWTRISDKQDRAHLLNLAANIFHHDGQFCETEKALYDTYLAKHLDSLDIETVMAEVKLMAEQASVERANEDAEMEAYGDQFSLMSAIKRWLA